MQAHCLLTIVKIFMRMGLPTVLTSDQGGEFKSNLEKEMMSLLNIKRHYITPYHPQVILTCNVKNAVIIC